MALYFNATINCGADAAAARSIAARFEGLLSVAPDVTTECSSRMYQAEDGSWLVTVQPMGVSNASCIPGDVPRGELLSDDGRFAVAEAIYAGLRAQTGYRFALVGFETQEYESVWDSIPECAGIVICEDLVGHFDDPGRLKPFRHGYLWIPIFPGWPRAPEPPRG